MIGLMVKQAGPMVTVQDLGRRGLQHAGVSGSGPMDVPSFRIANALVANAKGEAALEFAGTGGTFQVSRPVRFAVTGGAVGIRIDDKAVRPWESHDLFPGSTLVIGGLRNAVWGYLAISGGIDTPPVLGSRATHLRSGLGGHQGRRLQAGDSLPLGDAVSSPHLCLRTPWRSAQRFIHIVPGPQDDYFDTQAWAIFLGQPFIVSAMRDRMAQMLDGPVLLSRRGHDIVSDGTAPGSIQVPGSGRPIVLMAERQTTGGYPKIATVASVDLPRLAQTPSGRDIRFRRVSRERAEDLLIAEKLALGDALANLAEKSAILDASGDHPQ
ncbi:5-oxoprolinase subunit C family protein [Rhizobium herbae]|uniref:Biotin-dependent carboxylase-like uncharacterized protein n=1 Tax=Rhizobium herbae TaxID=508661 RepID=A0ABS4EPX1_9HYPH|nr:biotin-dependent carboxyltransferase family protein [Rhizobium herbae]MBP1859990.1 biotin-dependent carboxylase-like uncharacterized protein [Rhizobium herbae]